MATFGKLISHINKVFYTFVLLFVTHFKGRFVSVAYDDMR